MTTTFDMRRPGRDGPIVADGCVFPDGRCVLAWRGEHASVAVYPSPESVMAIHHHDDTWLLSSEGWDMSLDPWHAEAFEGTPAEGTLGSDGKRRAVWMALDAWGNAIGTGPGVTEHAAETSGKPPEFKAGMAVASTGTAQPERSAGEPEFIPTEGGIGSYTCRAAKGEAGSCRFRCTVCKHIFPCTGAPPSCPKCGENAPLEYSGDC